MDRRGFVRTAAGACGAFLLPWQAPADTLTLAFIRPPEGEGGESAARGVQLGVEEAARTGALMGRTVELRTMTGPTAAQVRGWRPAALIGGVSARWLREGLAIAEESGIPFLNVGLTDDTLRGAGCHPLLFHVQASDAMFRAAAAALPNARPALWHASLERFGAGQLNDRYRARFAAGMDDAAWAGWMAVKILWESSLRARSTAPAALLAYLRREATQFDGHKGWPLSFRSWDGQLRQPLYLLAGEGEAARLSGEVPTRTDPQEGSARELLDRYGADATTTTCARPETAR